MLKRLFGQKTRQSEAVALVRAEPEFVVEGRTVIAKACTIHWNDSDLSIHHKHQSSNNN